MNILILNSAHGKYPVGAEGWIRATVSAVRELAASGDGFICSTDPLQWDLLTYLAGTAGVRMTLVVKHGADERGRIEFGHLKEDFGLDGDRTTPMYLPPAHKAVPTHPKDSWQTRDRAAAEAADVIYPVSLRPKGRLDSLLREPALCGKVRDDLRIPWSPNGFIPEYSLAGRPWRRLPAGEWLVHWTRACGGKWPEERAFDFFRDLMADGSRYVRDAGATLGRIVAERRIRGSAWRIPGKAAAVAFSALSPGEAVRLMRWRKRFARMSFEPYGIAVEKNMLAGMGAREVIYTENGTILSGGEERVFTHSAGKNGHWAAEREWRLPGDLDLNMVPADSVRIVVPGAHEAEDFSDGRNGGFPVHTLFTD